MIFKKFVRSPVQTYLIIFDHSNFLYNECHSISIISFCRNFYNINERADSADSMSLWFYANHHQRCSRQLWWSIQWHDISKRIIEKLYVSVGVQVNRIDLVPVSYRYGMTNWKCFLFIRTFREQVGALKYKLPLRSCNTMPQETVSTTTLISIYILFNWNLMSPYILPSFAKFSFVTRATYLPPPPSSPSPSPQDKTSQAKRDRSRKTCSLSPKLLWAIILFTYLYANLINLVLL